MQSLPFRLLFVLLPALAGTLLQAIPFGALGHFQNLIWGLIFGLGWFVVGSTLGYTKLVAFFGFFIWPTFVCIALYRIGGVFWRHLAQLRWKIALGILTLTFLVVIPYRQDIGSIYSRLPLFINILNANFD
jgi:hypothetical protein